MRWRNEAISMVEDENNMLLSLFKGGIGNIIGGEDIVVEVARDIIKDEIKAAIKAELEKNPEIREEIRRAIKLYFEAKIKEMYASILLAKSAGKLGLEALPDEIKETLSQEIIELFEDEITKIIEKAL